MCCYISKEMGAGGTESFFLILVLGRRREGWGKHWNKETRAMETYPVCTVSHEGWNSRRRSFITDFLKQLLCIIGEDETFSHDLLAQIKLGVIKIPVLDRSILYCWNFLLFGSSPTSKGPKSCHDFTKRPFVICYSIIHIFSNSDSKCMPQKFNYMTTDISMNQRDVSISNNFILWNAIIKLKVGTMKKILILLQSL